MCTLNDYDKDISKQVSCRYCYIDAQHGLLTKCIQKKLDGHYTRML